ncbi:MAG TPA: hypothetical protein PKA81_07565 [Clostridia bacterium]|nr:hypothetical protein [Clostridia bacterium]
MTRFYFLITLLFFATILLGCSSKNIPVSEVLISTDSSKLIESTPATKILRQSYENWQEESEKWADSNFLNSYELVNTEQCAISLAEVILSNTMSKETLQHLELANIWDDKVKGVWVLSYSQKNDDKGVVVVGGEITIVINKHDAQIIKMWGDE